MKAEVRFYEKGFASAEAPEIKELREEVEVASKDELLKAAKEVELPLELPSAAGYAIIYADEEPVIGIGQDCVRDIEADEWIVEPESTRDYRSFC